MVLIPYKNDRNSVEAKSYAEHDADSLLGVDMEALEKEVASHLKRIVRFGCRMAGSAENRAASNYIRKVFMKNSLEVSLQEFKCPDWRIEQTLLTFHGKTIQAAANAFSLPCDVDLPTVAFCTITELEAAELRNRIGIMYGSLTQTALAAKRSIFKSEVDEQVVRLLEEKRPAAVITVNQKIGVRERIIEDYDLAIPSATVTPEAGSILLRSIGEKAHLMIKTKRTDGKTYNVSGTKAGKRKQRILICAHFDTKVDTLGANDNAAGTAVMLTLSRLLTRQPHEMGLEFVAFTLHEYCGPGSVDYVNQIKDLQNLAFVVNADGPGELVGSNTLAVIEASESFESQISGLLRKHRGVAKVPPWPESDHSAFTWKGVPAIAISCHGLRENSHKPTDTLEWNSPSKLAEATRVIEEVVLAFQDKAKEWFRKPEKP